MAHNYYQQAGGEDRSFEAEADLLQAQGHYVHRYIQHNDVINGMGRVQVARKTLWNREVYQELRALFVRERFEVAHFQNVFPLISPAAYYAAQDAGVSVVQSLRNYRLMCPAAIFFRDGQVCEDCLGKAVPLPGVIHGCYRDSRVQSAVVAGMLVFHRARRTWAQQIDRYIALTQFTKDKYVEGGFDPARIAVKPNFLIDDPGFNPDPGGYALYVGRITPEKGLSSVLTAWAQLTQPVPLKVIGTGPSQDALVAQASAAGLTHVEFLGRRPPDETLRFMKAARFLVFPSEWYETFGRVAVEAYAGGTPVIASKIGAIAEIVDHGRTGFQFAPGSVDEIARAVEEAWAMDDAALRAMRQTVRAEYEAKYTPQANYSQLISIYEAALSAHAH